MRSILVYILTIIVVTGCSNENRNLSPVVAAEDSTEVDVTESRMNYSKVPFDLVIEQLPLAYEGHDPREFYTNASQFRHVHNKDEFETTKQYEK